MTTAQKEVEPLGCLNIRILLVSLYQV